VKPEETTKYYNARKRPLQSYLSGFVILVVVVLLVAWFYKKDKLEYRGRDIDSWLANYDKYDPRQGYAETNEFSPVNDAIRKIGTRAVPHLVRLLEIHHSRWRDFLQRQLAKQSVFGLRLASPEMLQQRCRCAFAALGPDAKEAIPQLLSIIDTNNFSVIEYIMAGMENDAVPAFERLMTNENKWIRIMAVQQLGTQDLGSFPGVYDPYESREPFPKFDAGHAVPLLIAALSDSDPDMRVSAAWSLGHIRRDGETALPPLRKMMIKDPDWNCRYIAAFALGGVWTNAASALGDLEAVSQNDPNQEVRKQALESIQIIRSLKSSP
jgi:HEAT repeat protein